MNGREVLAAHSHPWGMLVTIGGVPRTEHASHRPVHVAGAHCVDGRCASWEITDGKRDGIVTHRPTTGAWSSVEILGPVLPRSRRTQVRMSQRRSLPDTRHRSYPALLDCMLRCPLLKDLGGPEFHTTGSTPPGGLGVLFAPFAIIHPAAASGFVGATSVC